MRSLILKARILVSLGFKVNADNRNLILKLGDQVATFFQHLPFRQQWRSGASEAKQVLTITAHLGQQSRVSELNCVTVN